MLDFFNSEFVTITVNLLVIIGFLVVAYLVMSKFLPSLSGEKLKEQIKTLTTS